MSRFRGGGSGSPAWSRDAFRSEGQTRLIEGAALPKTWMQALAQIRTDRCGAMSSSACVAERSAEMLLVGMGERVVRDQRGDSCVDFGRLRAQELLAARVTLKKRSRTAMVVPGANARLRRTRSELAAGDFDVQCRWIPRARGFRAGRRETDAMVRQGLAAEAERGDGEEVVDVGTDFAEVAWRFGG